MADFGAFDLHLSPITTDEQLAVVIAFMDSLGPNDRAIYDGDVEELTWFRREETEASRAWQEFKRRLRPWDVLLYGNHDVANKDKWHETFNIRNIIIMHGHQFDKSAGGCAQRTYYKWAPWVRNVWLNSPMEQKMAHDTSWQEHNGQVWGAGVRWLENSPYRVLVIGHTHDTAIINRPQTGKKEIGVGSLPEDRVYLNLDTLRVEWIKT
jgi:UDP-2,3-diacylglucosamine pyrophosphatase LpxH